MDSSATKRFGSIPALADLASHEESPEKFHQGLRTGHVYVAEDSDRIIGFIALREVDDALYIEEIPVREEHQGKGVGASMLEFVFWCAQDLARQKGAQRACVSLTYADVPWNSPWYAKHGFREVEAHSIGPVGVVLDTKLHMTAHIDKIVVTATKKCLAIGRMRGVRPKQMRQLHRAVIDTTTDYAASTWYARARLGVQQHVARLEKIQRMGAQAIIGAFRTVSSGVLQDEAGLEAVEARLTRKTARHALDVRALPQQHPLWTIMNEHAQTE